MSIYVTYLFYGAIFLSVLLLVEGLFYLLSGPGGGATSPNRRLRMLVSGVKREDVMVRLQRERPLPSGDGARNPVEWFVLLVAQSGMSLSPQRILLLMMGIGGAAAWSRCSRSGPLSSPGCAPWASAWPGRCWC